MTEKMLSLSKQSLINMADSYHNEILKTFHYIACSKTFEISSIVTVCESFLMHARIFMIMMPL
jgi:hypothetical protein